MDNQAISVRLPAEDFSAADLSAALDELLGAGNYVLTPEPKARGFQDEELGFSHEIASFLISVVSGTAAKLLSNLIAAELEKIKKSKKKNSPEKDDVSKETDDADKDSKDNEPK